MVDPANRDPLNPKKPEPAPSSVEPDEEEREPKSTLPPDVAEREAQKAIREIEEEIDEEHPTKLHKAPASIHTAGDESSFIDRVWERQYLLESRVKRIGHGRYSRVIKMARKPEHDEFVKACQITGIGIIIIGIVGFAIYLMMQLIMKSLEIR